MKVFLKKAYHWIFYKVSIRQPKAIARLFLELPIRPIGYLYTSVPAWERRIPNTVFQTWITPSLGRSHRHALAQFRYRNADFTFRFFSDADADRFMAEAFGDDPIYEVYRSALFGPLKMDIWRYCMLYHFGGVYCDIGKALKVPIRDLITTDASAVIAWEKRNVSPFPVSAAAAAVLQHPNRRVINWAMMFAPRHPIMKRAIDGIVDRFPAVRGVCMLEPKEAILKFTGPLWLTECILAAAETGELDGVVQSGIEFHDTAEWELPGSYVRYIGRPAYILARNQPIVS